MKFKSISRSWVAIHPQAIGIVQFIGGAFFGTFAPTFFYRGILSFLYEQGYTVVVIPFSFTFNHYNEAGFLISEQYDLIPELVKLAMLNGYDERVYLDDTNYEWLGHSIGCKYITLLEGFTSLSEDPPARRRNNIFSILQATRNVNQINTVVAQIDDLIAELGAKSERVKQHIQTRYQQEVHFQSIFIRGQSSVIMAPVNTGTDAAVPSRALANFVDRLGLGVSPSPTETFNLIRISNLFNKMGLVSFHSDKIAKTTVDFFIDELKKPPQVFQQTLMGGHFRPMGDADSQGLFSAFFNAFFKLSQPQDLDLSKAVRDYFSSLEDV